MSDREAFEKWAEDKSFILCVSSGDGYINVKEMAQEAWQAAQAQAQTGERKCSECGNGEPDLSLYCVRCLNNDGWYLTDDAQAQAVNQQLLEALVNTQAIIEMLYPKINRPDALNLQIIRNKAAIAAAQE
jgi:hypothetical protein